MELQGENEEGGGKGEEGKGRRERGGEGGREGRREEGEGRRGRERGEEGGGRGEEGEGRRERGGRRMKTSKCFELFFKKNILGLLNHHHGMADLFEVQSPSAIRGDSGCGVP